MTIPTVIVGLGRIGAGLAPATGRHPRNHLDAVRADQRFSIVGLVDIELAAFRSLIDREPDLADVFFAQSLDDVPEIAGGVVTLCGPAATREQSLLQALRKNPKLVVVEKPFSLDLGSGLKMAEAAAEVGVPLIVNHQRAFDPAHRTIRASLKGVPRKVIARYSGGLFNYGSHLVDLLLDWFGPVNFVRALGPLSSCDDPNASLCLSMSAGFEAHLIGVDGVSYDQFEFDLLFEDYRLELANGGVERRTYLPVAGLHYPGYRQLRLEITEESPVSGLAELYAAVADYVSTGAPMDGCDAGRALQGLAVLQAAIVSARSNGAPTRPEKLLH